MFGLQALGAIGDGISKGSKQYIDIVDAGQDRKIKQAKIAELDNEKKYKDAMGVLDPNAPDYKEKRKTTAAQYNKTAEYTKQMADELQLKDLTRNDEAATAEQAFNDLRRKFEEAKDPMMRGMILGELQNFGTNKIPDGLNYTVYGPSVVDKNPQANGWRYVGRDKDGKEVVAQAFDPNNVEEMRAHFDRIGQFVGTPAQREARANLGLRRQELNDNRDYRNKTVANQTRELEGNEVYRRGVLANQGRELGIAERRANAFIDQSKYYGTPIADNSGNLYGLTSQGLVPLGTQDGRFSNYAGRQSGTGDKEKAAQYKSLIESGVPKHIAWEQVYGDSAKPYTPSEKLGK
jgi:hypothetical protein